MPPALVPLTSEHLPAAARLLAQRQARCLPAQPLLPARFATLKGAQAALQATLALEGAQGFAALREGVVVGYILGETSDSGPWGRSAWVQLPGLALAEGESAELARDLYAALGDAWVQSGYFEHHVVLPPSETALQDAFFRLSFGLQHVNALLDAAAIDSTPPPPPPGVTLRRAAPADRDLLLGLSDVVWRHQLGAPVWAPMRNVADNRAGWAELLSEPDVAVFLLFAGDQPTAVQSFYPLETGDTALHIPERAAHLAAAGTRPEFRGRGYMNLLTRHGLAWAREAGYRVIETDWRSTNLLSSRYWPRFGFLPAAHRLHRHIDPRILEPVEE
jgi:ribosomal protein S18 acetylase RimI-like enzyme